MTHIEHELARFIGTAPPCLTKIAPVIVKGENGAPDKVIAQRYTIRYDGNERMSVKVSEFTPLVDPLEVEQRARTKDYIKVIFVDGIVGFFVNDKHELVQYAKAESVELADDEEGITL